MMLVSHVTTSFQIDWYHAKSEHRKISQITSTCCFVFEYCFFRSSMSAHHGPRYWAFKHVPRKLDGTFASPTSSANRCYIIWGHVQSFHGYHMIMMFTKELVIRHWPSRVVPELVYGIWMDICLCKLLWRVRSFGTPSPPINGESTIQRQQVPLQ